MTLNTLPPPPLPPTPIIDNFFIRINLPGVEFTPKTTYRKFPPDRRPRDLRPTFNFTDVKYIYRFFFFFFKLISHQVIELRLSFTLIHLKPVLLNFSIPPFPS